MDPIKLKIPPGFFRNGTEYESSGRWYDGSLVRWENGRIRPWGGWRRVLAGGATLTGAARAVIAWRNNDGFRYAAIGTNEKLYIGAGGSYADLTPVDLITGRRDGIEGPGYGAGGYGEGEYGTPRDDAAIVLDPATWSFDLWGDFLVAVLSSDGRIFEWDTTGGIDPAAIAGAPVDCSGVLVTDEAHLFALGAGGNRRKVAWCSQGDNTLWTPSDLSTAGSRNLKTGGVIVTGRLVGGLPLIWTTNDLHAMDYLGPPLVYNNRTVGENCGAISPNAIWTGQGVARWMGPGGFFEYDGAVRPIDCEVQDYVFGDMNQLQRGKIYCGANARQNEITWFYASSGSLENDRYVTLNYGGRAPIWYFGELDRTCWLDRGVFQLPMAVDANGVLFEQEVGSLADNQSRAGDIFLTSGPAEIGDGDHILYSNMMIPDVTGGENIQMEFRTRTAPMGPLSTVGPYPLAPNSEGYIPIRVAGRQAALHIEQTGDETWTVGTNRLLIAGGGKR